jgi:voltage-gated potassium channel Kch
VPGFERALYFSIVTYTTLGYGDIVLDENWRLLSSFQAANGIIIFGWTTAVIIVAIRTVSRRLSEFGEVN